MAERAARQLARRWARGAVHADPTWAEGYRLLGFSYMKTGAPAVARAVLEDCVTIDPNQAEAHAWLGELALDREDWEAASE